MNKSKIQKLIIVLLTVIIAVLAIILLIRLSDKPKPSGGVKWNGDQVITQNASSDYIKIPCVEKMYFEEGTTKQKVNIYNPSENKCNMDFVITLEDTGEIIWREENVKPGNGFYEININRELEVGVYQATLSVKCKEENSENYLNGGIVRFQIIV